MTPPEANLIESCFGPLQGTVITGDSICCEQILFAPAKLIKPATPPADDAESTTGGGGSGEDTSESSSQVLRANMTAVARTDCSLLQIDAESLRSLLMASKMLLHFQPGGVSRALKSSASRTGLEVDWICTLLSKMPFLTPYPVPAIRTLSKIVSSHTYSKGEIGEGSIPCALLWTR